MKSTDYEMAAEAADPEPEIDRRVTAMQVFVNAEMKYQGAVREVEYQQKRALIAEKEMAEARAALHDALGLDTPSTSQRTRLSDGGEW